MALFTKSGKRQVLELPIDSIVPNSHQPRQRFDPGGLDELSRSITEVGVLQPLTVRRTSSGWELIAGERRLRAARLAGLSTVPCLPAEADEESAFFLALIENLQRADLDVWEEATALKRLIEEFCLSQEETGRRVGMSQSAVANKLRLLKLPDDVIDGLRQAGLTERHARALLRLPAPDTQRSALKHIVRYQLNVAQTENYVDRLCRQATAPRKAVPIYRTKDVRLFINSVKHSLSIMQSAGVDARLGREESEHEITLTIHIPK